MYYCTDTSNLYIDYQESRFQINANFSNGLHYVKEETEIELDAETLVSAINSKSTIYFGDTQPENLTEQDLWIQFLSDNKSQLSYIDTNGIIHNIFPVTKKENIGIYVTQTEPVQVTDGDIWIDTSGTPADSGDMPVQTGVEVISNSNAANLYVWRRNEGLENTYLLTASAAMRLHSFLDSTSRHSSGIQYF